MQILCTIRWTQGGASCEFLLRDVAGGPLSVLADRPVLAYDRNRVDSSVKAFRDALRRHAGAPDRLAELGDTIGSALMPPAVRRVLGEPALQGAVLILETDDMQVPWELTRIDGQWLWTRFVLARRPIGAVAQIRADGSMARRALIVADPEATLPAARREAEGLAHVFQRGGWQVDMLAGPAATAGAVLQHLERERYGAVHFACAARFDSDRPAASLLFLADEPLPAGRLADLAMAGAPRLVFLNACQAGADVGGWARIFLDAGVATFVGPMWDVSDEASSRLSSMLYDALLQGAPVGDALRRARLALGDDAYATAHACVLYGSPMLTLESTDRDTTMPGMRPTYCELVSVSGARRGAIHPIVDGLISLGSASVEVAGGQPRILGNAVVNETVTSGPVPLALGDLLRVDDDAWLLAPQDGRYYLEVMEGETLDGVKRCFLREGATLVGRAAECAVRLHDRRASRHHLSVMRDGDACRLRHQGSNPTLVNGFPLVGERDLRHGDVMQVGERSVLRFVDREAETYD